MKFDSLKDIIHFANKSNKTISEVTLEQSAKDMGISEEKVYNMMYNNLKVMKEAIESGLEKDLRSVSGITGGMASKMKKSVDDNKNFSGQLMGEIIYSALSTIEVNASMGKIVASPTAGSCGILPGCIITIQKHFDIDDRKVVMAMINASAVGLVIAKNASISGAVGGCQAECGTSAAMTASAICELLGGTPDMCGHATAQALKSLMGLVCDPVAGLVEEPCIIRNASSASVAVVSAEMSLAGIESVIPVDEVISAMKSVGQQMPMCLKETADGGIAATPTGRRLKKELFDKDSTDDSM